LLYSYSDVAKLNYFIDQKEGSERRVAIEHLNAITRYAEDERTCRRKPLLNYFGESYTADNCSNCDNCTTAPTPLTDVTIYAQKFLSCVKRADEKFGAGHIVDILLGSKNEKVLRWEHDKLSTYGIGMELSKKQWMDLARQLLSMGYMKQEGEFRTLSLTARALEALKKRETIFGVVKEAERVQKQGKKREEIEYNSALFALLRLKRKTMADEAGVPPYVIFSDKTLVEMAAYYPQSEASLLNISGVGQAKLRQFGAAFLEIIKFYCAKHGLEENPKREKRTKTSPAKGDKGEGEIGPRTRMIAEAFNDGATVQSLMERHQVTQGTILEHLTKYVAAGNALYNDQGLQSLTSATPAQQQAVFAVFDEVGHQFLKPAFDAIAGKLGYDELRALRILYILSKTDRNWKLPFS
jgi:ATP-dependent DNA helicase RecQ